MARLPTPGSDDGNWGDILNDYLEQAHKEDGTLKDDILTDASIAPANIDGDAATPSLRTLGNGAQQAYPGAAGAANAATIAALEESADSGLVTEMAHVRVSTLEYANNVLSANAFISLDSYVSVTPAWFTMGTDAFTITQPGLYLLSANTYIYGGASNYSQIALAGNQPGDNSNVYYGVGSSGAPQAFSSLSMYVAVYDVDHPNPESGSVHSGILTVHTNSVITMQYRFVFSGGGVRYGGMDPLSITRLQSNPITL